MILVLAIGLKYGTGDAGGITFMLGDVNRDGVVDIKDVTILRRYLAGTATDVDVPAADCNEDGVVDIKDVTILRRYLAGTAQLGK